MYGIPGVDPFVPRNKYISVVLLFYGVMSHVLRYWVSRVQVVTYNGNSKWNVAIREMHSSFNVFQYCRSYACICNHSFTYTFTPLMTLM